jgi:hypothetical protein
MNNNLPDATAWTIVRIDPLSGELVSTEEEGFRQQIREEAGQGFVGIDALYLSVQQALHQPLVGEQGTVLGDSWLLKRANRTTLRVPVPDSGDPAALEEAAVTIARAAIDDFAAEVMLHLFSVANDPPNWRRPEFSIRLSELLDRLGFKRDNRGLHRSDARRRLTRTLLALHLTHVGLQRHAERPGGRAIGFIAPLLSSVAYATQENVSHLSPIEVFEQGLPEQVAVSINPVWYEGLRRRDGSAGNDYVLIPRSTPRPASGRPHAGQRSPVVDLLREYFLRCQSATGEHQITVSRQALLKIANVRDRNPHQAGRTLAKALDALRQENQLLGFRPDPLPLGAMDMIHVEFPPSV